MTSAGAWTEDSAIVIVNRRTWLYCGLFGGLYRTADEGVSWQSVDVQGALPSCNYYEPYLWQAASGNYYLPAITYGGPGLLKSQPNDTSSWTIVPNSPQAEALVPTEQVLVLANERGGAYWTASKADPSTWTTLSGPPAGSPAVSGNLGGSAWYLAYDGTHHVLYSSTFSTGLWRTVMP